MELDLYDAIRLHLIIEIDAEGGRYTVEPHSLTGEGRQALQGFVVAGPVLGWKKFPDWKNLKIANKTFAPRGLPPVM